MYVTCSNLEPQACVSLDAKGLSIYLRKSRHKQYASSIPFLVPIVSPLLRFVTNMFLIGMDSLHHVCCGHFS